MWSVGSAGAGIAVIHNCFGDNCVSVFDDCIGKLTRTIYDIAVSVFDCISAVFADAVDHLFYAKGKRTVLVEQICELQTGHVSMRNRELDALEVGMKRCYRTVRFASEKGNSVVDNKNKLDDISKKIEHLSENHCLIDKSMRGYCREVLENADLETLTGFKSSVENAIFTFTLALGEVKQEISEWDRDMFPVVKDLVKQEQALYSSYKNIAQSVLDEAGDSFPELSRMINDRWAELTGTLRRKWLTHVMSDAEPCKGCDTGRAYRIVSLHTGWLIRGIYEHYLVALWRIHPQTERIRALCEEIRNLDANGSADRIVDILREVKNVQESGRSARTRPTASQSGARRDSLTPFERRLQELEARAQEVGHAFTYQGLFEQARACGDDDEAELLYKRIEEGVARYESEVVGSTSSGQSSSLSRGDHKKNELITLVEGYQSKYGDTHYENQQAGEIHARVVGMSASGSLRQLVRQIVHSHAEGQQLFTSLKSLLATERQNRGDDEFVQGLGLLLNLVKQAKSVLKGSGSSSGSGRVGR